jgi:hypothetical protein
MSPLKTLPIGALPSIGASPSIGAPIGAPPSPSSPHPIEAPIGATPSIEAPIAAPPSQSSPHAIEAPIGALPSPSSPHSPTGSSTSASSSPSSSASPRASPCAPIEAKLPAKQSALDEDFDRYVANESIESFGSSSDVAGEGVLDGYYDACFLDKEEERLDKKRKRLQEYEEKLARKSRSLDGTEHCLKSIPLRRGQFGGGNVRATMAAPPQRQVLTTRE